MRKRILRSTLGAGAVALALAAPAHAAGTEVGMEDDGLLLNSANPAAVAGTWKALGVDSVRIIAPWGSISASPNATRPPANYANRYNWAKLDRAVNAAHDAGLLVMLTIPQSGGPRWASLEPRKRAANWKVNPKIYASFAGSIARRYAPQVSRYLIGNEVNQRLFMAPQIECKRVKGKFGCDFTAANLYRDMVRLSRPLIKRADPSSQILVGELAPIGSSYQLRPGFNFGKVSLKPLAFIRALACVDNRFHAIRTGGCKGFRAVVGDGFGYHPYEIKTPPYKAETDPDLAKIADIPRLLRTLNRVRSRIRTGSGVYMTEFAYETDPPDYIHGVPETFQSRYLQQAAYLVWLQPRVRLLLQYGFVDDPVRNGNLNLFQSGLFFGEGSNRQGQPKCSLSGFAAPFFIDLGRGLAAARFWGQVRPGGTHVVNVKAAAPGGSFTTIRTVTTDGQGYFSFSQPVSAGSSYYYVYDGRDSSQVFTVNTNALNSGTGCAKGPVL